MKTSRGPASSALMLESVAADVIGSNGKGSASLIWHPGEPRLSQRLHLCAAVGRHVQYPERESFRTHADPTLASMSSSDNTTTSYMKCGALADDSTLALCVVWWIALTGSIYTALKQGAGGACDGCGVKRPETTVSPVQPMRQPGLSVRPSEMLYSPHH